MGKYSKLIHYKEKERVSFTDGNTSDSIHPNTTIVSRGTSGFQQVFAGLYSTASNENKVVVDRIVTVELCGESTKVRRVVFSVLFYSMT